NAHGAHLHFFPESRHPIALGADMCCDSAHKMLPALTGGAFLHTARPELAGLLRQGMSMFGSTSPSYLIMGSLELCGEYIEEEIRRDILRRLPLISGLKESFSGRLKFAEGEPFHITVKAAESGFDGDELGELLRKNGVECEYSDRELLILLMSPVSPEEDFPRLKEALERALSQAKRRKASTEPFAMELPQKAMTIRQAALSPCREIPVEEAQGRICASVKVPCPPAIPIAASGEVISAETINIFKRYGISSVIVVE
ncbi:MAG: amino acid decarboxylase, partial [Ruminococcus sp.]|nr:amino acid decarboxylase [Ruminococcus sp.]